MAVANKSTHPKTAAELLQWLEGEVGAQLREKTEAIAHGGTALTLLGIKDSTKDVDFSFRSREGFESFVGALGALGFNRTQDVRPNPREVYHRLENPSSVVEVVDLRYPTWNNWRVTPAILRRSVIMPFGNLRVIRLDRDAIFLYKTYPLRETDIDDLKTILSDAPPHESRVIELFDEQDGIHRSELRLDTEHEPILNILELRVRFAGSIALLSPQDRKRIPRIARHANDCFLDLRLKKSLKKLVETLRRSDLVSWDDIVGDFGPLRKRLLRSPRGHSEPTRHRRRRPRGRGRGPPSPRESRG